MWQVRFPKGWHDIDAHAQLRINNAYDAGHSTVQFQVLQSQRLNLWRTYEIDFTHMKQTNLESGRIREVRLFRTYCSTTLALEDREPSQEPEEEGDPDQQGASSNRPHEEARRNEMPTDQQAS